MAKNDNKGTGAPAAQEAAPRREFKVKRNVTLPVFKFQIDEPAYLKITGAMFKGKEMKGTGEKAKMEPATLANGVDLETGEEVQIIFGTALASILHEDYANDSYVGLGFRITKHAKKEGKNYYSYSVAEIELP